MRFSFAQALRVFAVMALSVITITGTAPRVSAQAQPIINSIVIEGNQRIEDGTVLAYAGLTPGEPVSAGQLNAAYQRIVNSGLFEEVEFIPSGNRVTIRVVEYPTVNRIAIEGNQRLDDEVFLPILQTRPRRVYNPTTVENDARVIAEGYRQAGRIAATVTPKLIPRAQNRVDVVFEVTEGAVVEVERIGFVGNRAFSDRRLRQALGTKQAGFLRTLIGRDHFVEDRIDFDRQALTDFYQNRGYVDFEVLSVSTELAQERNAFFITFFVREGRQFKIGDIALASDVPEITAADYEDIIRTRTGQLYTPLRVDDTIARLERQLVREGRDFVRVTPEVERDDRNQVLNLTYRFERGPRVFVERIDIEGNTTTLDEVIRRQFDTIEGDPFNPREIRQAAERIRALGFFETSDVNTRQGTSPDRVIVDVDVAERPTGNIGFGLNYSVSTGVGAAFNLSQSNFRGRGQFLSLNVNVGEDTAQGSVRFVEPALLGRDISGAFEIFYDQTENFGADFDTQEIGFSPSLTFNLSEYTRLRLSYRLAQEEILNVDRGGSGSDNGSSVIIQREEGLRINSEIGYSLSFDTRRVGLDPNSGVRLEFSQDLAGLGGDSRYIRTTARATGETKLFGEDLALRARLEGGVINALDGQNTTVIDRFSSTRRVRGFAVRGFGPRDLTATNDDSLGGNYFAALRTEADFPIGLPEELGVRGGVFFDMGSVWGLDDAEGTGGTVDDDFSLRATIGASVFWTTPIGPLRFDFSRALLKEDFDDEQNFDFTISTNF